MCLEVCFADECYKACIHLKVAIQSQQDIVALRPVFM